MEPKDGSVKFRFLHEKIGDLRKTFEVVTLTAEYKRIDDSELIEKRDGTLGK